MVLIWGSRHNNQVYTVLNRYSNTHAVNDVKNFNLRATLGYRINDRLNMGIQGLYSSERPNRVLVGYMETEYYQSKEIQDSVFYSTNKKNSSSDRYAVNYYVDLKIDSLGKTLKFDIDYLKSDFDSKEGFNSAGYDKGNTTIQGKEFMFRNNSSVYLTSLSSSLDALLPYEKFKLNFGTKVTLTETSNKIKYSNHSFLNNQNDDFKYNENIFAAYGDYEVPINKILNMKLGLRVEYTWTEGVTQKAIDSDASQKEDYFRLFPTFFLGLRPSKNHAFNLSLSSRITRPGFRNVNPFVLYINEFSTSSGKPDLKPQTIQKINLGYTFKGRLSFDLFYANSKNVFSQVTNMDSVSLISETQWDNVMTNHDYGINSSYFFNNINWLEVFLIQGVYYKKSISNSEYTKSDVDGITYILSMNNRFFINKKRTVIGSLSGYFSSKEYSASTIVNPSYNLNVGLQYSLLNNKLRLGFNIDNLVTSKVRGMVNSNGMKMNFNNSYSYRTYSLSLSYNWGALLSAKSRKYSSSEIQERL